MEVVRGKKDNDVEEKRKQSTTATHLLEDYLRQKTRSRDFREMSVRYIEFNIWVIVKIPFFLHRNLCLPIFFIETDA